MVNLSRSVLRRECEVVYRKIDRLVKEGPVRNSAHRFAGPAFEEVGKGHSLMARPNV